VMNPQTYRTPRRPIQTNEVGLDTAAAIELRCDGFRKGAEPSAERTAGLDTPVAA
jgi:hypothetical protein